MASSAAQYPCFCSSSIKSSSIETVYSTKTRQRIPRRISISVKALNDSSSPVPPSESQQVDNTKDPVKLAFAKAKAYKKAIQSNPTPKISQLQDPDLGSCELGEKNDGSVLGFAMEKAEGYKEGNGGMGNSGSSGPKEGKTGISTNELVEKRTNVKEPIISASSSACSSESQQPDNIKDPVKLALAKAKAYKKAVQSNPTPSISQLQVPDLEASELGDKNDGSVSEFAMEKAKDYGDINGGGVGSIDNAGSNEGKSGISTNELVQKRKVQKQKISVSAIDFLGLGFSDKKKTRGLPPGLVPMSEPFPDGDLPEVEIIVGDRSKFGNQTASTQGTTVEEDPEIYKPTVSTWGVFPRPKNISKTYGGGKVIRPGEELETAEAKAAKEKRTRQLIAAYKSQKGLNIDPKLRSECEQALEDGDSLMDRGKLKEALPFYEKVMNKLIYQSELHGLAALQWAICQDSLTRSDEAQIMYEKLQSHPTVRVSKKARQFVSSFQAMEMLRVKRSTSPRRTTEYQSYFEAFVEKKKDYSPKEYEVEVDEDSANQVIPYVLFLVSPILMVLVIAVQKRLA